MIGMVISPAKIVSVPAAPSQLNVNGAGSLGASSRVPFARPGRPVLRPSTRRGACPDHVISGQLDQGYPQVAASFVTVFQSRADREFRGFSPSRRW